MSPAPHERNAVIMSFTDRAAAESAMERLLEAGFPADHIVLIGDGHPPRENSRVFRLLVRKGAYVLILYGDRKETIRADGILRRIR